MKFNEADLFGIYTLVKIEATKDSIPTNERANDGLFVFTRERKLSVVSGANEWVMAYTGDFSIQDDVLSIRVKACVTRELEGTIIQRKILSLDGTNLILEASNKDQEKRSVISWKKITPL